MLSFVQASPIDEVLLQDSEFSIVENICYSSEVGKKGYGDLFLPKNIEHPRPILLIHGGAWKSMDRYRMQYVAAFLARQGYAVFNTSYRLLPEAPYPACEDDCIAAAMFVLDSNYAQFASLNRKKIVLAGFSSGGHLAMMTGLKLPRNRVAGIIDGCGPSELHAPEVAGLMLFSGMFSDQTDKVSALKKASPTVVARTQSEKFPPLLVLHCQEDGVVDVEQAYRIIDVWKDAHANCQCFLYAGSKTQGHNIWRKGSDPVLYMKLERQIVAFLDSFFSYD